MDPLEPRSILVVDPDQRTHRAFTDLFERPDLRLRFAETGREAIEEIRRTLPAVLVTELALVGMDGLSLLRVVRRDYPQIATIILTGAPCARSASRALRLGIDDYIIKGADSADHVRSAVFRAMRKRAHDTEVRRLLVELNDLNEAFMTEMNALQRTNLELENQLRPPDDYRGSFRMLVVDDEAPTVALLATLLRSQGFSVDGAHSGTEARALFAENKYDLVLTDKNLGDASGVDLISEIHAVHPDTRVLLMTGFATVESAVDAIHLGAVGYLRKPFNDLSVVIHRVDEALDDLKEERAKDGYTYAMRTQNSDFVDRYRLVKNKLATLQQDDP